MTSRRKQSNPRSFKVPLDPLGSDLPEDEDEIPLDISSTNLNATNIGGLLPENTQGVGSCLREMDEHICGICRAEFVGLARFIAHKKECHKSVLVPSSKEEEEDDDDEDEDEENETITPASKTNHSSQHGSEGVISTKSKDSSILSETSDKVGSDGAVRRPERVRDSPPDSSDDDCSSRGSLTFNESNIAIQSLRNTRVAVAQHQLSSPSASDHDGLSSPPQLSPQAAAAQLCSLQQQHVMLMSVIHQLTSQLMTNQPGQVLPPSTNPGLPSPLLMPQVITPRNNSVDKVQSNSPDHNPLKRESPSGHLSQVIQPKRIALSSNRDQTSSRFSDTFLSQSDNPKNSMHALQSMISETNSSKRVSEQTVGSSKNSPLIPSLSRDEASLPLIPSPVHEPAPASEPNTLELLQRHTEQALQNTMSGSSFLVNGVSGSGGNEFLRFRKDGKEDPSLRHRCKYCGKVFGSDSALQIHIRSHTGERPFKCNICGNRFSTKGNLKVHFQRHRAKYPHVKMNPNPVPEHLDKFHPPLEPPSGSQSPTRSQSPIFHPGYNGTVGGNNPQMGSMAPNTMTSFSHSIPNMIREAMDLGAKINQTKEYIASTANNGNTSSRSLGSLMSQMDLQSKTMMEQFRQLKRAQSPHQHAQSPFPNEHSNESSSRESSGINGKKVRKSSEIYERNQKKPDMDEEHKENEDDDDERGKKKKAVERCEKDENGLAKKKKKKQEGEDTSQEEEEEEESLTERGPPGNHHSSQESSHELSDNEQPEEEEEENDENGDRDILRRAAIKAAAELNRRKSRQDEEEEDDDESNDTGTNNSFKHGMSGKREDMGDDEDDRRISNKFPFLAPNFQSFFQHGVFPSSMAGMMPPFSMPPTMTTSSISGSNNPENCGISGDPILYQDLLPKPGSTDNTWESLMEIQKASETTKLQNLVDNIENKLKDPNQCIICHRILSCKSALQMHYRTHTGERPFKCKICGRAFTTKGNLKTHMGVHRVKPPLRILHQCPVCHKQFTNALVLQQHIRIHTGEPTDMSPEHMLANEIKSPLGSFLPTSSFHRHLLAAGHFGRHPFHPHPGMGHPFFPHLQSSGNESDQANVGQTSEDGDVSEGEIEDENSRRSLAVSEEMSEGIPSKTSEVSTPSPHPPAEPPKQEDEQRSRSPSMSTSLTALENHVRTINSESLPPPVPQIPFGAFGMGLHQLQYQRFIAAQEQNRQQQMSKLEETRVGHSPTSMTSKESVDGRVSSVGLDGRSTPGSRHETEPGMAVDLTPKTSSISNAGQDTAGTPDSGASKIRSPGNHMPPQLGPQMFPPLFAGLPFPSGRTSTTCRICLKTFACNSALEIHYRSHTKERPFKCDVCDRGFSTKGNMKQHMLTHKIRDLPSSLYTTTTTPSVRGGCSNPRSVSSSVLSCDSNGSESSLIQAQMTKPETDVVETGSLPGKDSDANSDSLQRPNRARSSSPGDGKRNSSSSAGGSNRHICNVCRKPFSSHSALQIHMRTHTGDKPFQCSICSRAFTTKGNLKVHMGTHMWNNGSSRRGRRMSIDLPNLHINPTNGSNGSYPSNFYSMVPLAFMNGMRPGPGNGPPTSLADGIMNEFAPSHHQPKGTSKGTDGMSDGDEDHNSTKSDGSERHSSNENDLNNGHENSSPSPSWNGNCNFCGEEFDSPSKMTDHIKKQCREAAIVMKQEKGDQSSSSVVS